jgi:glycosyltransferase involved in cell wall biosynthesis
MPAHARFAPLSADPDPVRPGVNVVGYLHSETGVGEAARALVRALRHRGHPVACTVVHSPDGSRQQDRSIGPLAGAALHDVTLVCVNASEVATVQAELGPAFFAGRYNIGVWFWELDTFPADEPALSAFDEIWCGSTFVQRAIAAVAPVPVIAIGVPVTPPADVPAARARLGLPTDRHLVLFAFDALSVVERKHPLGVVAAYRRAFGDRPAATQLVIKASRLELFPAEHSALRDAVVAVGGRLIDHYLDRASLAALFHACDNYVSLHRSEGFGLTIAEAMSIGKAVVATGWSGNLDFMTPANSCLVRWSPLTLTQAAGPYPAGARWADADLDDAAWQLRRLVTAPDEARQLGRRAAADLARSHGLATVGRRISARLAAIHQHRCHRRSQ